MFYCTFIDADGSRTTVKTKDEIAKILFMFRMVAATPRTKAMFLSTAPEEQEALFVVGNPVEDREYGSIDGWDKL